MNPCVIWDWNGTLLKDVDVCITAINRLLDRRSLRRMTWERYREVFSFPVRVYYEEMGFDFSRESFDDVAIEFHEAYEELVPTAPLHDEAIAALTRVSELGIRQAVLSALEQGRLRNELRVRKIDHYFTEIYGLSDLHARSKVARGRELLRALESDGAHCWMIGDTDHDAEVARQIGVRPVLVAGGHHSARKLEATGAPVVENALDAVELIVEAAGHEKS